MNKILLVLFLFFYGCYRVPDKIEPKISYQVQDLYFAKLHSAFPPLSIEEEQTDWGKEYRIAHAFAQELDLYRAVSTFKRSAILIPETLTQRKLEIQYDILLCFFLGKRYEEAVEAFEKSHLAHVDTSFPAYHDLLLVLYECYHELENPEKQQRIYELLEKSYPDTAEKITLSGALRGASLSQIHCFAEGFPDSSYLDTFLQKYEKNKKSVSKAQFLNAILPGAGYLYIGQKKSALTAFLLNGLFITAATQFFLHNHVAAGIITAGFESGWYFGGIYGAGEEAKYYNERLYEQEGSFLLNEHHLFPTLMMRYSF